MDGGYGFIAVEWGTAAIRASLLKADGTILDRWSVSMTLADTSRDAMVEKVEALHRHWPQAEEIWLSGMIGSAAGWLEVPHIACPVGLIEIASQVSTTRIGDRTCRIIPGLSCRSIFGSHDVLRGEEMLALGWLSKTVPTTRDVLVCVPGMHGKWLTAAGDRIDGFHTAMTVELIRMLASQGTLGQLVTGDPASDAVFVDAVERGASGGASARLLFEIRARVVAGDLAAEDAASALWGVLIGADVGDALAAYRRERVVASATVVGETAAAQLFAMAIGHLGLSVSVLPSETLAAAGFAALRTTVLEMRDAA